MKYRGQALSRNSPTQNRGETNKSQEDDRVSDATRRGSQELSRQQWFRWSSANVEISTDIRTTIVGLESDQDHVTGFVVNYTLVARPSFTG